MGSTSKDQEEKVSDAAVIEAMGITTSKEEENPYDVEQSMIVIKKATPEQTEKAREQLGVQKFEMGGSVDELGYMYGGVMKETKRGPIKYSAGGAIKGKNFRGSF